MPDHDNGACVSSVLCIASDVFSHFRQAQPIGPGSF